MPQGRCCGEAPRFATGVRLLVTKLPRLLILLACVTAVEVGAQSLSPARAKTKEQPAEKARREPSIPKRYVPPAGMCRIWVDNVPSGRQPAPTDCTTAIRNLGNDTGLADGNRSSALTTAHTRQRQGR